VWKNLFASCRFPKAWPILKLFRSIFTSVDRTECLNSSQQTSSGRNAWRINERIFRYGMGTA
jgi:hypothetical protein